MKHPHNEIYLNVRRNTLQMYFTFRNVRKIHDMYAGFPSEKQKAYNLKNQEHIRQHKNETIVCQCGSHVTRAKTFEINRQ